MAALIRFVAVLLAAGNDMDFPSPAVQTGFTLPRGLFDSGAVLLKFSNGDEGVPSRKR